MTPYTAFNYFAKNFYLQQLWIEATLRVYIAPSQSSFIYNDTNLQ